MMGVPKMNKKLYRNILIAMMVSTLGTTAVSAADTVVPVDLARVEAQTASTPKKAKAVKQTKKSNVKPAVQTAQTVRPVDITPELREELAQQIAETTAQHAEKAAAQRAKTNEVDPVITVGRVSPNQAVDLTLPKTVQMALDYNRDIKVAGYDLKSAEYAINEAKAGKMPSVSYKFDASHASKVSMGSDHNSFGNGLSVELPIYTGGKVEGAIASAKLGKTSAQEEVLRTEQATKLAAVKGYFDLLMKEQKRDVANEAVTNYQTHLDNATAQYNVGTVAKIDVLSSGVDLANAKSNAVAAGNDVANAEANLNNILGLPLQTKLVLADHKLPFDQYNISLQEALDYAMKYRPEVLQAALSVQQAEEQITIDNAGNKPTVAVSAGQNWADTSFPGTSNNKGWNVAGGVTFKFFDGGATNAKVAQAKQALLKARETEQKTRETVQLAVKQAYLNIQAAAQSVEATRAAVDQAEESFKIARVRYQAGVGTNTDVLDAQYKLNTTKNNHIEALYNYNVGIAQLEQAMGVDVRSGVVHPSLK